jgi:D-aspartate ligase
MLTAEHRRTVIIIGGYNVGFSLVRSLKNCGYHLVILATAPFDYAQHSRFVDEWHRVDSSSLVDWLLQRAHEWPDAVLIPTSDAILEKLLARREEILNCFRAHLPEVETYERFQDKAQSYKLAEELGIDQPETYTASSRKELLQIAHHLTFPVLLKPAISHQFFTHFRRKLWVIHSPQELERRWTQAQELKLDCIVTEWIQGPDRNLFFYVSHHQGSENRGGLVVQKLRQHPPGFGVGRVARTVPLIKPIQDATHRLLSHCHHHGFSSAEFKQDPRDGRYKFIEINLRPVLQDTLFTEAGINFTQQMVRELHGFPRGRPTTYRSDVYWHYASSDLIDCLRYLKVEKLGLREMLSPYLATHSVPLIPLWEDPRLFLIKTLGSLAKALKRLAEK